MLTAAQFPKGVAPGQVPEDAVYGLGLYYAPTLFVIWMLMIASLNLNRIDRSVHDGNSRVLAAQDE